MGEIPPFVQGPLNVPYFLGVWKFFCSYPHSFRKMGVHEVVSSSEIYQSFFVGHCVTCANRNWNAHRSIVSDIHRVTFKSPHPGHRVQAFGKSNPTSSFLHMP